MKIYEKYLITEGALKVGMDVDFDDGRGDFRAKVKKISGDFAWVDIAGGDRARWKKETNGESWKNVKVDIEEDITRY